MNNFALQQWHLMREVVECSRLPDHHKVILLWYQVGKLEGYGLAQPTLGAMPDCFRMADRIKRIADKVEQRS